MGIVNRFNRPEHPLPRSLLACCLSPLLGLALAGAEPLPSVQPPPFLDGLFPCAGCHDGKKVQTNSKKRPLEDMHENIVLHHLGDGAWCFQCHDPKERNRLHLANGQAIDFTLSYQLCGQCHADKLQDWRAGRHGKDPKAVDAQSPLLLCVSCHNPHSPQVKRAKAPRG
jgi:hypothetical protein